MPTVANVAAPVATTERKPTSETLINGGSIKSTVKVIAAVCEYAKLTSVTVTDKTKRAVADSSKPSAVLNTFSFVNVKLSSASAY